MCVYVGADVCAEYVCDYILDPWSGRWENDQFEKGLHAAHVDKAILNTDVGSTRRDAVHSILSRGEACHAIAALLCEKLSV